MTVWLLLLLRFQVVPAGSFEVVTFRFPNQIIRSPLHSAKHSGKPWNNFRGQLSLYAKKANLRSGNTVDRCLSLRMIQASLSKQPPKYAWGSDDYFPLSLYTLSILLSGVFIGLPFVLTAPTTAGVAVGMQLPALSGVVLSNLAYLVVYYSILGAQVSYRMQNKENLTSEGMYSVQRITGNTLEQMVPFLLSQWLYAAYVDAAGAATLGWLYVFFRALYGPLWAVYGEFTVLVELSTNPAYSVIYLLVAGVALKVITGGSLVHWLLQLPVPSWVSGPIVTILLQMLVVVFVWGAPPNGHFLGQMLGRADRRRAIAKENGSS